MRTDQENLNILLAVILETKPYPKIPAVKPLPEQAYKMSQNNKKFVDVHILRDKVRT